MTAQYFCCSFSPNGIGDLMFQLQQLYNIGRSLGLEYLYRDLPRNRWSPDLDESDFLGLALGERQVRDFPDHTLVPIDAGIAARAVLEHRPIESVLPSPLPEKPIIELVNSGLLYSANFSIPRNFSIDLRAKLVQRHGPAVFARRTDRLSIRVHIRLGDCTWVERAGRSVFVGKRKVTANPQDPDILRSPLVPAFQPMIDLILESVRGRPYDLTIYSDGPSNMFQPGPWYGGLVYRLALRDERVLRWLRFNRPWHPLYPFYNPMVDAEVRLGWEQAKTALENLAARYDGAKLVVGTTGAADAILEFASADIVVLSRNPGVFPLLGLGDPERQAVLLLSVPARENETRLRDFMTAYANRAG